MSPRTSLAQKMDALSAQASRAGYVAVILAALVPLLARTGLMQLAVVVTGLNAGFVVTQAGFHLRDDLA